MVVVVAVVAVVVARVPGVAGVALVAMVRIALARRSCVQQAAAQDQYGQVESEDQARPLHVSLLSCLVLPQRFFCG